MHAEYVDISKDFKGIHQSKFKVKKLRMPESTKITPANQIFLFLMIFPEKNRCKSRPINLYPLALNAGSKPVQNASILSAKCLCKGKMTENGQIPTNKIANEFQHTFL